jgi:membrane-associated HD superfamily phosphohydrolase
LIRNSDKVFHFEYYVLLVLALFISSCAVGVINFIDTNKSLPKLNLSKEQQDVVEPKIMSIKVIVDKYELEKRDFDENASNIIDKIRRKDLASGDSDDRAEYLQMVQQLRTEQEELRNKREEYLSLIKEYMDEIKAVLAKDQLVIFEKMELPKLSLPKISGEQSGGTSINGGWFY